MTVRFYTIIYLSCNHHFNSILTNGSLFKTDKDVCYNRLRHLIIRQITSFLSQNYDLISPEHRLFVAGMPVSPLFTPISTMPTPGCQRYQDPGVKQLLSLSACLLAIYLVKTAYCLSHFLSRK